MTEKQHINGVLSEGYRLKLLNRLRTVLADASEMKVEESRKDGAYHWGGR